MIEYLWLPIILLLYWRTYKYKFLIDDHVPRGGYLLTLFEDVPRPSHAWLEQQRPWLATFTNIGTFIITCWAIHLSFGWKAALLYAIFPLNVSGVAWITGNYYMSTAWLIMVCWYLAQVGWIWLSSIFYITALGTTVAAIPFAFYYAIVGWSQYKWLSLIMFVPLFFFIFGYRFQTGLAKRKATHDNLGVEAGVFRWNKLYAVVKVTAYYLVLSLWPSRLGFFHDFYRYEEMEKKVYKPTRQFWLALTLLIVFFIWGITVDWKMTLWWFFFIGIFSQFVTFGQFVSERYTYIANIGFCVLVAKFLPWDLFLILATLYFYRTHLYIPAWKNCKTLFIEGTINFPKTAENYVNLSSWYIETKQHFKAAEVLLTALKVSNIKQSFNIHMNLANCYIACAMFGKAYEHTLKGLEQAPLNEIANVERQLEALKKRMDKIDWQRSRLKKEGII